jgi:hypothetical protein
VSRDPAPTATARPRPPSRSRTRSVIAAYYIVATDGETYHDLGADHIANRDNPERRRDRLVTQLTKLGYQVELHPAA